MPASKFPAYHSDYQALRDGPASDSPAWLNELREHAWARFDELGFPTARRGNERWKYTNVAPIARVNFAFPVEPGQGGAALAPLGDAWDGGWLNLMFVDGHLSFGMSTTATNGVIACGLTQAVAEAGEDVRAHLAQQASFDDDGFAALNTAFLHDGAYLHAPDRCRERLNVRITYVNSGAETPAVTHPRSLIVAGEETNMTVVECFAGPPESQYFTNAVTEIVVGEGARVDHYRLLLDGVEAYHVGTTRVSQAKDSTFESAAFSVGTALGRNDFSVTLGAPGAYCSLNGLYYTTGQQHMDNLINIDHAMPNCTSRLAYKGILDGKSRAVFGGTVLVRENAQKSDAQQSDKNLLLSAEAEVDSKPSLLIYADDVKCSHGATAGHIDADTIFYLRSRGLDLEQASRMLVQAFAREIIDSVKPKPLQGFLDTLFDRSIAAKSLPVGSA